MLLTPLSLATMKWPPARPSPELRGGAQAEGGGQQVSVPLEALVDHIVDAMVGASE